jgi:hypothetical protein
MRNKIKARSHFKSNIENNPFKLLNMIRKHSMSYREIFYNMSVLLDSLITLLTTTQKESKASKTTQNDSKLQKKFFSLNAVD